jgi:cell division protein FtsL
LASWAPAASTEAAPRARRRSTARPRIRVAGGAIGIAVGAVVLAGVVFLNVAVLRLNLEMDGLSRERTKLRAENAALASQVSGAANSLKIESQARRLLGLEPAGPDQVSYLDLSK